MSKLLPAKKYLQITVVLATFFALVQLRQLFGVSTDTPLMGTSVAVPSQNNIVQPSPSGAAISDVSPTATPRSVALDTSRPIATAVPSAVALNTPTPTATPRTSQYKDGTFTGTSEDAYYGNVQVQLNVSNGKIAAVNFLQYPNDNGTSRYINSQAMPMLQSEVIQAQSGNVNAVSGASETSRAFLVSIQAALQQARAV